jgi:hypothetical protein
LLARKERQRQHTDRALTTTSEHVVHFFHKKEKAGIHNNSKESGELMGEKVREASTNDKGIHATKLSSKKAPAGSFSVV